MLLLLENMRLLSLLNLRTAKPIIIKIKPIVDQNIGELNFKPYSDKNFNKELAILDMT